MNDRIAAGRKIGRTNLERLGTRMRTERKHRSETVGWRQAKKTEAWILNGWAEAGDESGNIDLKRSVVGRRKKRKH